MNDEACGELVVTGLWDPPVTGHDLLFAVMLASVTLDVLISGGFMWRFLWRL